MKQKYINLYLNKSITKCVANAIQTSRLFLGEIIRFIGLFIVSGSFALLGV